MNCQDCKNSTSGYCNNHLATVNTENTMMQEFLKTVNFEKLAKAFAKDDIKWHVKEWKEFKEAIENNLKSHQVDAMEKLPNTYEGDEEAVFRTTKKECIAIIHHTK